MNLSEINQLSEIDGYTESFLFMFPHALTVKRFYNDLGDPMPQSSVKAFNSESFYRDQLAKELSGKVEVKTPAGLIDVLTDSELIEVKCLSNWKGALGQALAYGIYYPNHKKRIHLYNKAQVDLSEIEYVCGQYGVSVSFAMAAKSDKVAEQLEALTRQELVDFMDTILNAHRISDSGGAKTFYLNLFNKVSDFYMDQLDEQELEKFNTYLQWLAENPGIPFQANAL